MEKVVDIGPINLETISEDFSEVLAHIEEGCRVLREPLKAMLEEGAVEIELDEYVRAVIFRDSLKTIVGQFLGKE